MVGASAAVPRRRSTFSRASSSWNQRVMPAIWSRCGAFDAVVLAVGGHPYLEQNEHWGAAEGLVVSSWDVLDGKVAPGKNVLVYDTICEFTGMSVADFLADKGSQVEIVTDDIKPGVAIGGTSFPTYYRSMYPKEVIMTGDMMLEKVYREGDKLVAVLETNTPAPRRSGWWTRWSSRTACVRTKKSTTR